MGKKKATIRLMIDVEFEDNGTDDVRDQAIEAANEKLPMGLSIEADMEIVGQVEDA